MRTRLLLALALPALAAGCMTLGGSAPSAGPTSDPAAAVTRVSTSNEPAKALFGPVSTPSHGTAQSYGSYARGCLAGAAQLPETGPTWQAMRLSRNRNWGNPELIAFLERLSAKAAKLPGWSGLYIGDMSQPRGGPMSSGHASHQIGLDADIWMLPPSRLDLSAAERESLSSIRIDNGRGVTVNANWTPQHMAVLKAAAEDPEVARIFVVASAKVAMCKAETGDRRWLRKIRPWPAHNYHFHVRLHCPKGERACVEQAPPPPGDGCAAAEKVVERILHPPPPPPPNPNPPPPRGPLTLADLPTQCAAVLRSQ